MNANSDEGKAQATKAGPVLIGKFESGDDFFISTVISTANNPTRVSELSLDSFVSGQP